MITSRKELKFNFKTDEIMNMFYAKVSIQPLFWRFDR